MSGYSDEENERMSIELERIYKKEKMKKVQKKKLDSFKPKKFQRKRGLKKGMWRRKEKQ